MSNNNEEQQATAYHLAVFDIYDTPEKQRELELTLARLSGQPIGHGVHDFIYATFETKEQVEAAALVADQTATCKTHIRQGAFTNSSPERGEP